MTPSSFLRALLLLLALASQAQAQTLPTTKPPPLTEPPLAEIPGPVCTPAHRAFFDEALAEARSRTAEAIRFLDANPRHEHVTRWFGDTPPATVRGVFQRTLALLERPESLKLLCNPPTNCRGATFAWAIPANRTLGVCPAFFRARRTGVDTRWGILIHEATHIAAGTDDHAYGVDGALRLAKQDPRRAAENADNYEYFVEHLPR